MKKIKKILMLALLLGVAYLCTAQQQPLQSSAQWITPDADEIQEQWQYRLKAQQQMDEVDAISCGCISRVCSAGAMGAAAGMGVHAATAKHTKEWCNYAAPIACAAGCAVGLYSGMRWQNSIEKNTRLRLRVRHWLEYHDIKWQVEEEARQREEEARQREEEARRQWVLAQEREATMRRGAQQVGAGIVRLVDWWTQSAPAQERMPVELPFQQAAASSSSSAAVESQRIPSPGPRAPSPKPATPSELSKTIALYKSQPLPLAPQPVRASSCPGKLTYDSQEHFILNRCRESLGNSAARKMQQKLREKRQLEHSQKIETFRKQMNIARSSQEILAERKQASQHQTLFKRQFADGRRQSLPPVKLHSPNAIRDVPPVSLPASHSSAEIAAIAAASAGAAQPTVDVAARPASPVRPAAAAAAPDRRRPAARR